MHDRQSGEAGHRGSAFSTATTVGARWCRINFITAHDGFTLNDLVSYNEKHNEANLKDNRDGNDQNRSWNCGVEGPTDDPRILDFRARQRRNLLTTLLLSQGVPMITGGDEIARTQGGNNNGWCQDNEISWLDWKNADHDLRMFTQRLIGLRRTEPVFRRSEFLQGNRTDSGVADVGWLRPDGEVMTDEDCTRALAVFLNGREIDEQDPEGREIRGHSFLLLVNANHEPVTFTLPTTSPEAGWTIELSTIASERTDEGPVSAGDTLELPDRAMVILRRSQDRDLHVRPRQLRQAQPELGPRFDPYGHQVALFLALEGVADQPDQGWPQADEEGPALGVAALVLVDRLGADPQRDAERHGTK